MSTKIRVRPSTPAPTGTRGDQRHGAVAEDDPDRPGALELPTDEAELDADDDAEPTD